MSNIQTSFSKHLQKGLPGQLARANAPYDFDLGVAGVEVKPGQGVYFDGTSKFILPTSDATRKLVTHIVSYDPTSFNTDIAAPSTNNITEVVFAADAIIKLASLGSFFVQAGETVKNGDAAIYNESTGKWIIYAPSTPTANDLRAVPFVFYLDPLKTVVDTGIVEVKIQSRNYAFASLNALPAQTIKVSLAVGDIKALRATPFELVAAQGAGTMIEFVAAVLKLTAGSEVLSESTDNLVIEYDDGSGIAVSQVIECTGFIDQAADTQTNAKTEVNAIAASSAAENKNLVLFNNGDGEFAGNASDDAALDVHITYRVHSV